MPPRKKIQRGPLDAGAQQGGSLGKVFGIPSIVEPEPKRYQCPECGSTDVNSSVKTVSLTYCTCRTCPHVWHEERTEPHPESPHKRRKGDSIKTTT